MGDENLNRNEVKYRLDPEAREAIRSYIIRLAVLPAGVLGALSFTLGYFVNEGARGQAYAKAYGQATQAIIESASTAATAAANSSASEKSAKQTEENLKEATGRVQEIALAAEEYKGKLDTVTAAEQALATEVATALLRNPQSLSLRIAGALGEKLQAVEDAAISGDWIPLRVPAGWEAHDTSCRVHNGWIEFRGFFSHPPISGWPSGRHALLPEGCRPITARHTEMPCHAASPPRNRVCNNDFYHDGTVAIYTDFPVTQQRFEGVRIWGGS